jgi:hypothetical protein
VSRPRPARAASLPARPADRASPLGRGRRRAPASVGRRSSSACPRTAVSVASAVEPEQGEGRGAASADPAGTCPPHRVARPHRRNPWSRAPDTERIPGRRAGNTRNRRGLLLGGAAGPQPTGPASRTEYVVTEPTALAARPGAPGRERCRGRPSWPVRGRSNCRSPLLDTAPIPDHPVRRPPDGPGRKPGPRQAPGRTDQATIAAVSAVGAGSGAARWRSAPGTRRNPAGPTREVARATD